MKRSKEAIITKVLEICIDGASKTAIVYQANLNFHTVVTYINLLIDKGLLRRSIAVHHFKTTSNGIKLMEELESIRGRFLKFIIFLQQERIL